MKTSKKYAVRTVGGIAFQMPKIWKKRDRERERVTQIMFPPGCTLLFYKLSSKQLFLAHDY